MILIHDECNENVGAIRRNILDLNSALSNLLIRVETYIGVTFQESCGDLIIPEVNSAKMQYRDTKNNESNRSGRQS